jgi:Zn-dependent protease with chaperone function
LIHVEHFLAVVTTLLAVGLGLALVLNTLLTWISPVYLARDCWPLQLHHLGPKLEWLAREHGITAYFSPALYPNYAYSTHFWFQRTMVIDHRFFHQAPQPVVDFVVAHEIGHHFYGHPWRKMLLVALHVHRWPLIAEYLRFTEEQANRFAEIVTGHPRSIVWGMAIRSPTEEKPA